MAPEKPTAYSGYVHGGPLEVGSVPRLSETRECDHVIPTPAAPGNYWSSLTRSPAMSIQQPRWVATTIYTGHHDARQVGRIVLQYEYYRILWLELHRKLSFETIA